jgi:hypothetical protein
MARPQVADGGDEFQIWKIAANALNKQSRIAENGWSSSLDIGCGDNNPSSREIVTKFIKCLGLRRAFAHTVKDLQFPQANGFS